MLAGKDAGESVAIKIKESAHVRNINAYMPKAEWNTTRNSRINLRGRLTTSPARQ